MARIAIFCDGTWNSPTIEQPTHVVRLHDKTPKTNAQSTHYVEGVGTGGGEPGFLRKSVMKIGGGAFGWGLNDHIKQAYTKLCEDYEPGDEIFVFGFSRGAYTARSLVGMIRKSGIVEEPTRENVDAAFELYRLRGHHNHPDALHILHKRRNLSPRAATSDADADWRSVTPSDDHPDPHHKVQISYVGVWDTVGALGVPKPIAGHIATLWNRKYHFHDMSLTSMVKAARHAVALDERRVFFAPSLWTNLEATRDDPGLNKGDRSETRPYQQTWFVGTHSIVGGSDPKARKLTGTSLMWIVQGAQQAGLEIDTDDLLDALPDPMANSLSLTQPPWLYTVVGHLLKWRDGPGHPVDLHSTADARVKGRRDYRPRSLRNLMPALFGVIAPPPAPDRSPDGPQR